MARKDFAMISTSLPYSKKYRALPILAKLVYNHLHYSSAMNYLGVCQFQDVVLAHEIDIPVDDLNTALVELAATGLIELHGDHEIIRIIGWFHKANGATNASHASKLITDFGGLEFSDSSAFFNSVAEFTIATLKRGLKWKKDADNLRNELRPLLNTLLKDHGNVFAQPLLAEINRVGQTLQGEIHALAPGLSQYEGNTQSTPCTTGGGHTRRRLDETILRQNINENETKTYTGDFDVGSQTVIEAPVSDVSMHRNGNVAKPKFKPASESAKSSALVMGVRK